MSAPLVVVGDSLLDVDLDGRAGRLAPDAPAPVLDQLRERPRPGGAALAAAMARAAGTEVVLVTATAPDEAGDRLRKLVSNTGVELISLALDGATPQKIRVRAGGQVICRLDRGCDVRGSIEPITAEARSALSSAGAILVADYGRGITSLAELREDLEQLAGATPIVWDPHPLGAIPVPKTRLATPNGSEARKFAPGIEGDSLAAWTARARALKDMWEAVNVAVTMSAKGALLVAGDAAPMVFPATAASGDTCGAGDRFSSAAAAALQNGALPSEAVQIAVETASDYVAQGGIGRFRFLEQTPDEAPEGPPASGLEAARRMAETVKASGGTVVATGGCFDLLHAGHIQTLQAARALGDCLIVTLNSDRSVGRLKGPGRPLVGEQERAAVLAALGCVDAVVVFEEDTPEAVLGALKPDLFVKGGDYALTEIPEKQLLEGWGGQVAIVPYVKGRSTSALIERMAGSGAD
jgi:D-beta-D-heptose 7-phosphate kinase/D-beta-D-heptose 1-phosphate adenosyltransferase